ncbi:MAG: hypothetical protein H0V89_13085 [Deltaproteobacteria bacterium]|nr:hypothetical protein [Deltaproteobacteria bacterium]
MASLAPVVRVYDQGTSWQLASLSGEESPRRVVVKGSPRLIELVGRAFPEAEVRLETDERDREWADLIVEEVESPTKAKGWWVDRIFRQTA